MNTKKKPMQAEKIGQLEAGLDFQNRESAHILEMVRKHHAELLDQQDNLDELKAIMRIYSIVLLACVALTLYFACK
jgi:cell division protein FtsX